jgi:hypothetical protein
MSNNVPDTIEATDNVPETAKRGRGRPRKTDNVSDTAEPNAYFGKGNYINVTLYVDQKIYKAMKIMAIDEETSLKRLINEALATWVKWLYRAARDEAKTEDKAVLEKDLQAIESLVRGWRGKKYAIRMNRIQKSRFIAARRKWKDKYPGMPLSGYNKKKTGPKPKVDNVPDITI